MSDFIHPLFRSFFPVAVGLGACGASRGQFDEDGSDERERFRGQRHVASFP